MSSKKDRIYIIPTRYGFMYAGGIIVCFLAATIYSNNLAYLLCFFLVALFLMGMVQTHVNLKGISLESVSLPLIEEGGMQKAKIWLRNKSKEDHQQLFLEFKTSKNVYSGHLSTASGDGLSLGYVPIKSNKRGVHYIEKLKVSTVYPFGMFYSWKVFNVHDSFFVYPMPEGQSKLPQSNEVSEAQLNQMGQTGDDFSRHKDYMPGHSQRHIDWKAYARGRPLLVKEFGDGHKEEVLLSLNETGGDLDTRLRQLSLWIELCMQQERAFSLDLGTERIGMNFGETHRKQCLVKLAEYGMQNESRP